MPQMNYDIYINTQTAKNPIYDERWDASSVYGDDVDSQADGVVHVWNFKETKTTLTKLITAVKFSLKTENITNKSTATEITNALEKWNTSQPNQPAYNFYHKQYPYTDKGIYTSLADIFDTNNGEFAQILKFDTVFHTTAFPVEPDPESSYANWTWYGNGKGFVLNFSYSRDTTIDGQIAPGEFSAVGRVYVKSGAIDQCKILVSAYNRAISGISDVGLFDVPVVVAPAGIGCGIRYEYVVSKISDTGKITSETITQDFRYTSASAVTKQFTDSSGKSWWVCQPGNPSIPLTNNSVKASFILPAVSAPSRFGNDYGTQQSHTYGNVSKVLQIQGSNSDIAQYIADHWDDNNWIESETEEITYNGDLCVWYASDYELLNKYKRTYQAEKLTDTTSDTITLHFMDDGDTPETDPDDYYPPPDPGDDTPPGEEPVNTGSGYLTTTYSIGDANLRLLGQWVWSDGYQPLLKNSSPLENIVSLVSLPFTIKDGTSENITIGASDSKIPSQKHTGVIQRMQSAQLTIDRAFGNFFDFEPYTHFTLYVPFIGFRELSPAICTGVPITLNYAVDISNGNMSVECRAGNQTVDIWNGNCGISLPLTASNDSEKNAAYVGGLASMLSSAVTQNWIGVGQSALDLASISSHYQTTGSLGGATAYAQPLTPFIIIDRPNFTIPAGYGHQHGFRCEKTLYLSQCRGFTVIDEASLTGLTCTDEEAKEIERLLREGVYL